MNDNTQLIKIDLLEHKPLRYENIFKIENFSVNLYSRPSLCWDPLGFCLDSRHPDPNMYLHYRQECFRF